MQKRKSFLMKLLVLLTVVFCTFALAFGMVGCAADGKDGANGKDGVDGVSIQSAIVDANGDLIITLTDGNTINAGKVKGEEGPQGGTLDTNCAHDKVKCLIREGSCTQEQVLLNICTKCDGYELVVGQKDSNNHVKYLGWKVDEDGFFVEDKVTDITIHEQTELEEAMKACPEKTCNLCKTDLEAHEHVERRPVSSTAAICEEEWLYTWVCLDCKAYVSDIEKADPIGHKYAKVGETGYTKDCEEFTVLLECEVCGKDATAKAKLNSEKSVVATCAAIEGKKDVNGNAVYGYDVYTYEYDYSNGTAPEKKTADIEKDLITAQGVHTFKSGDHKITAALNENINWIDTNDAALTAMFADKTIRTIAGVPTVCSKDGNVAYTTAVADCDICNNPITFNVSGKHTLGQEVKATCIADGYIPCSVTGCPYSKPTDVATGHVYAYVEDSFVADASNANKGTVTLKCTVAGCATATTTLTGVEATFDKVEAGKDCKNPTYNVYKTVAVNNGLASTHKNYKNDIVVVCKVEDKTAVKRHELATYNLKNLILNTDKVDAGTEIEFSKVLADGTVVRMYNDDIAAAMVGGTDAALRWIGGIAGTCATHWTAMFDCTCCLEPITINLMGPHTEVGELKTEAATCTTFGYTYKECSVVDCLANNKVIYDYIEPLEHDFVVVESSKEAFLNDLANATVGTTKVQFTCATCDKTAANPVDFVLKEIGNLIPGESACNPIDRTPYTFEYSYQVTKSTGAATVVVPMVIEDSEGQMSHKLTVDGKSVDDIWVNKGLNGQQIVWTAQELAVWRAGLASKQVRWIAGVPGTCQQTSTAVFDCCEEGCGVPITVILPGDCTPTGEIKEVKATCTTGGYKYQDCSVCGRPVIIAGSETTALGHDYEWAFAQGAEPAVNGKGATATYTVGTLVGTCKRATGENTTCGVTVNATAQAVETKATCCDAGSVVITYKDAEGNQVLTKTLVIPSDPSAHNYNVPTGQQPPAVKEASYVDLENKVVYNFKWCFVGERYVLQGKVVIVDADLCETTGHTLTEVYNNGEIKVIVCEEDAKAYIVEIEE